MTSSSFSRKAEVLLTSDKAGFQWNFCVWDPLTGSSLMTYKGGSTVSKTSAILGDTFLVSAQEKKPILNVWLLNRHEQQALKITTPGKVRALACSPDGKFLVAGIQESVYLWQSGTGRLLSVLNRHYQDVTTLVFTDDGSYFVSGGKDGNVLVWSVLDLVQALNLRLPGAKEINSSSYEPEPKYIWDQSSLEINDIHVGHGGPRARIYTTSRDQSCRVYDLASGTMLLEVTFSSGLSSLTVDSSETHVYLGTLTGQIHTFSLTPPPRDLKTIITKCSSNTFSGHSGEISGLSVSIDESTLASGSLDNDVKLWHIPSRQCIRTISHKGEITCVRFLSPPPPGMLDHDDFKQNLTFSQLSKVVTSRPDESYTLQIFTRNNLGDEEEERKSSEFMKNYSNYDSTTEVSRLKQINYQLYQSAMKFVLNEEE